MGVYGRKSEMKHKKTHKKTNDRKDTGRKEQSMKQEWTIKAAMVYDKGSIRKGNEDAYYFNGKFAPLAEMNQSVITLTTVPAVGTLWAICDGMGGQSSGEVASYTAVSGMKELQRHLVGREFSASIQSWVHQASMAVERKAEGGGTTLVMLYCTDQDAQTAHIGDSRIYRMHEEKLSRITRDHSKVEMMVAAGIITEEEAETHPQRHTITRYLGMNSEDICDATVGEKIPFVQGDRYLLCSDGVTDMLRDAQIEEILRDARDVKEGAERLRDAVFAAGARDNTTLILLEVGMEKQDGTKKENGKTNDGDIDRDPTIVPGAKEPEMKVCLDVRDRKNSKYTVSVKNPPKNVQILVKS